MCLRALCVCAVLALSSSAARATPEDEAVKKLFTSDNYTVTWGTAATYTTSAVLETGDGSGHGSTLGWMRFQPGKDGVDVLSIRFDKGWEPYKSKWPPDRAPVVVQRARMKADAYAALLRAVAVVGAAQLKPVARNEATLSTHDFWVQARLTANKKTLLDLDWAGYDGSRSEVQYARPRAIFLLASEAAQGLDFKNQALTDEERAWASAKFARDWKNFKDDESHWWVRERSIITIGVVGDASALPTLRDVLGGNAKDRCVYYAINAVTRLTKKDVRDKPVEEMDVEKTRPKVLELIRDAK